MIYLDNSATTYPKPEIVYKTLNDANRHHAFNAGRGSYKYAKEAMLLIDNTRKIISKYVSVDSNKVIFTSSATESMNMIVKGLEISEGDDVYVSPFEHNAVIRPLAAAKANIHIIPFNNETWEVEMDKLNDMFAINNPKCVFLSHISNVTGYVLPYEHIFAQSKKYNSINVLDCAQSFGVLQPRTNLLDYIVFAGHKSMYGPFGAAGFIEVCNKKMKKTKAGGTGSDSLNASMPEELPQRYEAGTMNVVAISAMAEGFKWVISKNVREHEEILTNYLIEELKKIKKVKMYIGKDVKPLGIVSISIDGYQSSDVSLILSEDYDICTRSGYHCAPFVHDFIGSKESLGTVRISVGAFNTKEEIDVLINALKGL